MRGWSLEVLWLKFCKFKLTMLLKHCCDFIWQPLFFKFFSSFGLWQWAQESEGLFSFHGSGWFRSQMKKKNKNLGCRSSKVELVNRHWGSPPCFPPAQEVQGLNNNEGILWFDLLDFRTSRERKVCISFGVFFIPQWKGRWWWETPTSCVLLPFWRKRERKRLVKAVFQH